MIYCMYEDEKGTHHAVRLVDPKFHFKDVTKDLVRAKAQKRIKGWINKATRG